MDRSKLHTTALVRLVQSVERWQARNTWQSGGDPEAQRRVRRGPFHTRDLLRLLPEDWREKRIEDLLPVMYSEGPEWEPGSDARTPSAASEPAPAAWAELLSGGRAGIWDASGRAKLLVHLARVHGEAAYFLAFLQDQGAGIALPRQLRTISVSRSGMAFPTLRSHEPGETLLIVCFLPQRSDPRPLILPACVVRPSRAVPHGGYETPVRFVGLAEEASEYLHDYVASRLRRRNLGKAYHLDP